MQMIIILLLCLALIVLSVSVLALLYHIYDRCLKCRPFAATTSRSESTGRRSGLRRSCSSSA